MSRPQAIAIVGPTASGKSDLALRVASKLDGEIICMDSMQIYRRMDIGTAKPTLQEQSVVVHHMLDIVEPTDSYDVSDYARDAGEAIRQVTEKGKVPLLVGGTGLYLKALMHGLTLGGAGSDEKIRAQLNAEAQMDGGKERLYKRLCEVDPVSGAKLHPNDIRRVVRALEVFELTGVPISSQNQDDADGPFDILPLAIDIPRPVLYERLENRVHIMMVQGLLYEVAALLESGVTAQMQSMQGIGYKELIPVIQDGADLKDAVWQIILNTRHYAKRQGTWFRTEPRVVWLTENGEARVNSAMKQIEAFMKGTKVE